MKLYALDIPDDSTQLAEWLEGHLVGLDLAALVAELATIHGRPAQRPVPIGQILGDRLEEVRSSGLSALPSEAVRQLLVHPLILLDLQADVLENGGPYWDERVAQLSGTDEVARGLNGFAAPTATEAFPTPLTKRVSLSEQTSWWRHPLVVSLGTAAALLVAAFFWQTTRSQPAVASAPWGWNKPEALKAAPTPDEYLNQLASGAEDWFKKKPETAVDLAQRILQFRQGCSKLIMAEHKPLPAEDRAWLVERCRVWAAKLDASVAALEAGEPLDTVRTQADETIRKLIDALRARAAQSVAA